MVAWVGMLALQLFTAAVAFRFDHESLRPLWRLPLQQFAYRQLMYLVLIQSAMTALTGGRLRWHKLHRAGLDRSRATLATEAPMIPSTATRRTRRRASHRPSTPGRRCWTRSVTRSIRLRAAPRPARPVPEPGAAAGRTRRPAVSRLAPGRRFRPRVHPRGLKRVPHPPELQPGGCGTLHPPSGG